MQELLDLVQQGGALAVVEFDRLLFVQRVDGGLTSAAHTLLGEGESYACLGTPSWVCSINCIASCSSADGSCMARTSAAA